MRTMLDIETAASNALGLIDFADTHTLRPAAGRAMVCMKRILTPRGRIRVIGLGVSQIPISRLGRLVHRAAGKGT